MLSPAPRFDPSDPVQNKILTQQLKDSKKKAQEEVKRTSDPLISPKLELSRKEHKEKLQVQTATEVQKALLKRKDHRFGVERLGKKVKAEVS